MKVRFLVFVVAALSLLVPSRALAFCGFYVSGADATLTNDATRVVLMRDGTRTVLSMQNSYKGPVEAFAMVVPVPVVLQKENVKVLKKEVFDRIDSLSAPRLVEYWERDPCGDIPVVDLSGVGGGMGGLGTVATGSGAGAGLGVTIEAQFDVGEYEIVILGAKDSLGLTEWLHQEHYKIPDGAEPYLRPYVESGSKFFVAKVNPQKVTFQDGRAELSPLRFHYDTEKLNLPVRLGLLSSAGKQDLLVFILAPRKRYELANYKNISIPTNLDVNDGARASFSAFYATLFDDTLEKNPGSVVTEYAWDSASCDPCPVPALTKDELASLGGDVIPSATWGDPRQAAVPLSDVSISAATADVPLPDMDRVLAGTRPKMRACYNVGLNQDPAQTGKVTLSVTVLPNGEVETVTATPTGSLSPSLVACVQRVARNLEFSPGPRPTKLSTTVTLVQTGAKPLEGAPVRVLTRLPSFTITRLHARYGKDTLGQDLVFKEAAPIIGGREDKVGQPQDTTAKSANYNNFQARYVIRHPWEGALTCASPRRGMWGGPPSGVAPATMAAQKLATVSRAGVTLASFMGSGSAASFAATDLSQSTDGGAAAPPGSDAGVMSSSGAKKGCGCALVGHDVELDARVSAFGLALAAAWMVRRKRSR